MDSVQKNIAGIIEEVVNNKGFFVIELIIRGTDSKKVIEVFIDGEKDISAEDCAETSRGIEAELTEFLGENANYRLDVSSPGIDKPLKYLKQYPKHINRKFELSYNSENETKKLSGKLVKIDGEDLFFSVNKPAGQSGGSEVKINFNQIKKAKVIVSFS